MLLIVQTKLFSGEASTGALKRPLRADAFTLPERERLSVPKHAVSFSIRQLYHKNVYLWLENGEPNNKNIKSCPIMLIRDKKY